MPGARAYRKGAYVAEVTQKSTKGNGSMASERNQVRLGSCSELWSVRQAVARTRREPVSDAGEITAGRQKVKTVPWRRRLTTSMALP
jgi:hypothetical protein